MQMTQFAWDKGGRGARGRRALGVVMLAAVAALALAGSVAAREADRAKDRDHGKHEHEAYEIGLWGDLPYSTVQATIGVPNLVADMNAQGVLFSVHDGDLKTGNGSPVCDDALYSQALATFDTLKAPAMFTPGDNEWTDCDRPKNGGFNSLERLTHERQVFFSTPYSLGQHPIRESVQAEPLCLGVTDPVTLTKVLVPCVENRRWSAGDVVYATLNIQGSCNNLCGDGPDADEYAARNEADIRWMKETFAKAIDRHAKAIMLVSQADPGFSESEFDAPQRDPETLAQTDGDPDGYQEFLLALRDQVIAFGRPVVYVHGDSHYFRIDKPLLDSQGLRVETFTRVETFGDHAEGGTNDVNWVKVRVDPDSREVFAFQPQVVPANRTVPPPAAH